VIVVIDTSVWISGLQFAARQGVPTQALQKASREDTIATCDEIEVEIIRVLVEKFAVTEQRANEVLYATLGRCLRVQLRGTVKVCRDPTDDMVLECALRASADLLIAGDKDLLVLREFEGTRIVTPAAYLSGAF
jgi:putative PIN family toxin of toxin-antitoxin system